MPFKKGVVSTGSLEEILTGYLQSPIAQSDVNGLVLDLAAKLETSVFNAFLLQFNAFLATLDSKASVIDFVQYHEATTLPAAGMAVGEFCILNSDCKIYEYEEGGWDSGTALSSGDRYWHVASPWNILEYDGEEIVIDATTFGSVAAVEEEGAYYWNDGTGVFLSASSPFSVSVEAALNNALSPSASNVFVTKKEKTAPGGVLFEGSVPDTNYVSFSAPGPGVSWLIKELVICPTTEANDVTYTIVISNDTPTDTYLVKASVVRVGNTTILKNIVLKDDQFIKVKADSGSCDIIAKGDAISGYSILLRGSKAVEDYANLTAVGASKKWVYDLWICPTGAGTANVFVQKYNGASSLQLINNAALAVGNTVAIENETLSAAQYLKLKAVNYGFDYHLFGREEDV